MTDYIRYAKNIRRLAEQLKNTNSSLEKAQIRARIAAERRIGYITGNGNTAVSNPGVPGVTSPFSNLGNLLGFATDQQLKDVMNTINNNYKTINSVLNMSIGGKVNGINGLKDCVTGKKVEVNNTPIFKLPAGWLDSNTPGNEWERFTVGTKWFAPSSPAQEATTAQAAAEAARNVSGAGAYTLIDSVVKDTAFPHSGGNTRFIFRFKNPALPPADLGVSYYAQDVSCSPGSSGSCPTSFAIPWPVDNVMQLSRGADGKYKFSPNEPAGDVVPSLTDNKHSSLDLCFDDGSGRKASIEPTYDGGTMIFERNPITGERIGRGQLVDQNNTVIQHIMPDEAENWLATGQGGF